MLTTHPNSDKVLLTRIHHNAKTVASVAAKGADQTNAAQAALGSKQVGRRHQYLQGKSEAGCCSSQAAGGPAGKEA
jgi:hypothetical protein